MEWPWWAPVSFTREQLVCTSRWSDIWLYCVSRPDLPSRATYQEAPSDSFCCDDLHAVRVWIRIHALDIYDCFLLAGPYDRQSLIQEAEQAVALNRP
jgi:hypothetical protein